MTTTLFLTDLDDTLFRSLHKHASTKGLTQVTTALNDRHGFSAPHENRLLETAKASGLVIPVTARSREAFDRVDLSFGTKRAVLSNGAVVLDENGDPDAGWASQMSYIGHESSHDMRGMMCMIREEFADAVRTWIVEENDAPAYLCMKVNGNPDENEAGRVISEAGAVLMEHFDLSEFQHHVNGNNLSLTPAGISKKAAVEHLVKSLDNRPELIIGIGDSLTDLPFMGVCDFMMTPSGSQISQAWARSGKGDDHA